jgi:predicted acyl esterase
MNGPTNYANRAEECKKLLSFDAEPTLIPFEISGYPVVNMSIAFDSADGAVFCYLEDVAPDGSVTYITEGMFNPQIQENSREACISNGVSATFVQKRRSTSYYPPPIYGCKF